MANPHAVGHPTRYGCCLINSCRSSEIIYPRGLLNHLNILDSALRNCPGEVKHLMLISVDELPVVDVVHRKAEITKVVWENLPTIRRWGKYKWSSYTVN